MRSAAAAFAWELRWRHRFGLATVLLFWATLAIARAAFFEPGQALGYQERWHFGLVVVVPIAASVTYFLAIFSFGLAGDLATRRSSYPNRLFTYPVSDEALVRWPMLYGSLAMASLWLLARQVTLWPADFEIPLLWPALLAVVILAWTQALTWMPYPKRGLRVIVTVLWLATVAFTSLFALHVGASEPTMLAILTPLALIAYLVARVAIARARHGGSADIGRTSSALPSVLAARESGALDSDRPAKENSQWATPLQAQVWFEWRRHGRSLPALVALLLPFELCLLFAFNDAPRLIWATLVATLLTPPFLAIFVAATVNRSSRDGYELTQFIATRPLTSPALILAKLWATTLSIVFTWGLVLAAVVSGLWLSDTWPIVADGWQRLSEQVGKSRALGICFLAIAAIVMSTWKLLVQSLFIGMSGRPWLIKTTVFAALAGATLLVPFLPWVIENGPVVFAHLWNALPWLLMALVFCKMAAAAWVVKRLVASQLLKARTLIVGALCWDAAVLALYSLLIWLVPTMLVREYLLMMIAILAVPLARIGAAPLALSWNRHR